MVIFTERQKFRSWWMSFPYVGVFIITVYMAVECWYQRLDWIHLLVPALSVLVVIGMASVTLRTRIDEERIRIGFSPFGQRTILRSHLAKAYVRQYSPLADFGGWGYRLGRSGTAYTTMGEHGLQLELKNGKRILIGTQRPAELQSVMDGWLPA